MKQRVLIAAGGTGGHVYPAVALAKKIKEENPETEIFFAGCSLTESPYFDRTSFPFKEINSGKFPLKNPVTCLKSAGKVLSGIYQSRQLIKTFRPDIVVGFGSYHSLPVLIAAKMQNVPMILHEGNAYPGKVNRFFSGYAKATGIQFPQASAYLRNKTYQTTMPLRPNVSHRNISRKDALAFYGFNPTKQTVLVFGGSQGALSLNRLLEQSIAQYPGDPSLLQILHLTGHIDPQETLQKNYNAKGVLAVVKPFEEEMGYAWAVADLMIGRAGAGTIAEAIEFEVPSVFIPYPHAADDHQTKNGEYMANTVKGALLFQEESLTPKILSDTLFELLEKNPEEKEKMKKAVREYKSTVTQYNMSALVVELIPQRSKS